MAFSTCSWHASLQSRLLSKQLTKFIGCSSFSKSYILRIMNKPNDIVPMSTTHPTPAPTQLFCETIKPSQDLHSLCLKLGYTLESLFSRRCCILRPRKPWNHPWQTWQRRSTLLLCAARTGFSLPGVMKGSKNSATNSQLSPPSCVARKADYADYWSAGDSSWYTPQTPLPNHRSGLRPDELRSRSRLLQWKRTENLPAISTLSHTHLELERKNNIIGNNTLKVQATTWG